MADPVTKSPSVAIGSVPFAVMNELVMSVTFLASFTPSGTTFATTSCMNSDKSIFEKSINARSLTFSPAQFGDSGEPHPPRAGSCAFAPS